MDRFIIITGGPGAGKTTLVEALAARGHGRSVEAGRAIIQAQVAIGGKGVHWGDRRLFAELMLMHEVRSYEEASLRKGLTFFDRGVPELCGYLPMMGLPLPPHFERAAALYRYHPTVFAAPPWREIFAHDAERLQGFEEAIATYEHCVAVYRQLGYAVVELPRTSVPARVDFVLDRIERA